MKTLANPRDKVSLLDRLSHVSSNTPRLWGKMSAAQMICHLNDSYLVVTGKKPASSVENLFTRTFMKWAALWLPFPWPHGTKTMPEVDQFAGGTQPTGFEADRRMLIALTEDFAGKPAILATCRHPLFGKMSTEAWMRWAYLHMDHHLRQFGC